MLARRLYAIYEHGYFAARKVVRRKANARAFGQRIPYRRFRVERIGIIPQKHDFGGQFLDLRARRRLVPGGFQHVQPRMHVRYDHDAAFEKGITAPDSVRIARLIRIRVRIEVRYFPDSGGRHFAAAGKRHDAQPGHIIRFVQSALADIQIMV